MASTITVSVAVMHAGASVTADLPVAHLDYIELGVSTQVDSSGRFQYKSNIVLVVDAVSKLTTKPFADSFALADARFLSASKALASSIELQEAVQTLLIYVRNVADALTAPDAFELQILKAVSDFAPTTDANYKTFAKSLADAVGLNDGTSVGDGSTYSFTKSIGNVASVEDAYRQTTIKPIAETIGLSESGVVSVQGYCDITYFAEDYVGTSSSF